VFVNRETAAVKSMILQRHIRELFGEAVVIARLMEAL